MLEKYKQFHLEQLRTSAMVKLPIFLDDADIDINNHYGRHWSKIAEYVVAMDDIRPRQGTFTNPWGAIADPLFAAPPVRAVHDSLGNLLDQRACDLLQDTRRIAVMWSGGIDSTCMLAALIKNTRCLDQLVVYCSRASVEENTYFYKNHILGQIETRDTSTLDITDDFIQTHVLLHGDPADCLYGPSMPMYALLLPKQQQLLPWQNNRHLLVHGIIHYKNHLSWKPAGCEVEFANWYVDKVSVNIEEVRTHEISTIADWWWWHYFNLKWQFSILRPFYGLRKSRRPTLSRRSLESYVATTFYNTEYFQNWSYTNLGTLCRDPAKHKIAAKQYIFELDQNEFYFSNKRKTVSMSSDSNKWPSYLDQNLKPYYITDPGVKEAMLELLEQYTG
jgi:hypothetical protein